MRHTVEPATMSHMNQIADRLRKGDRSEIEATGFTPRRLLRSLWKNSHVRRTGFVDGEIAAVWGCAGVLLSPVGEMWLFTTPAVERVPMAFVKVARAEMSAILETKAVLVSSCLATYVQSVRLWKMLGFEMGAPFPMGPEAKLFRRMVMER